MTLGARVLDWLLRRHNQQKKIDTDLVLVHFHEAIADAPAVFDHDGEQWQFARVKGELALRNALLRGSRLVAAIPTDLRLPLDLAERAYLRRPITVEAHDIVAALAGNFCVRIQNGTLAQAILRRPRELARHGGAWTLTGRAVTETEVKQVLVAVELGFDRKLERLPAEALLARWLVNPPPQPSLPELADEVLREAHGRVGEWLAWALGSGKLDDLITAGALAGSERGRKVAPSVPKIESERGWETLRQLVEDAVREAWNKSPSAVNARLSAAEGQVHRLGVRASEAARHPLLRSALENALFESAHDAAAGKPPKQADLDPLKKNLHHKALAEAIGLVDELCRLARFCNEAEEQAPRPDASIGDWALFARDHSAWSDLAARSARRFAEHASPDLAAPRRRVLERYLEVRDALNARFATALARDEVHAYRNTELPAPLPLHLVTRSLLLPLVEAGRRVLLLVLDGCDLSSFYELLYNRNELTIGLSLPAVSGKLKGQLEQAGAMSVALSPLPTVTNHARRALFAGEIPGNPALDNTEAAVANASADLDAWAKNGALKGIPHRLLLKGDLDPDGLNVTAALEEPPTAKGKGEVLAVVLNGIDDALSSHEITAMGPWRFGDLGSGLNEILRTALRMEWTIVITSDHGHTPFWTTDRKAATQGAQRYAPGPLPGAVAFAGNVWRREPLHLLTAVGGYVGTQRRGFHGGAGLEEVVVPLALLGPVVGDEGLPLRPSWWTGEPQELARVAPAPVQTRQEAVSAPVTAVAAGVLGSDIAAAFHDQPRLLRVLEKIAAKGVISLSQLMTLLGQKAPFAVNGQINEIQRTLQRRRIEVPFTVEKQGDEDVYRWKIRS